MFCRERNERFPCLQGEPIPGQPSGNGTTLQRTTTMTKPSKLLTAKIAAQFLTDRGAVALSEFTTIEDAAAESLSRYEGFLSLGGLTTLSDTAAAALSRHKGDLELNGLAALSDAQMEMLSRHSGELGLNGLTTLSDTAAESLVKHECDVGLEGLTSLSNSPEHLALAEFLILHQEDLWLDGLTELSDEAAEIFSRHQGCLDLTGLRKLSTSAYRGLAKRPAGLYWRFGGIRGVLLVLTNFLRSLFGVQNIRRK